jgi:polar amino acid transport system permease protein
LRLYNFDWGVLRDAFPAMLGGLGTTLELTAITVVLSMILAVPIATARMSAIEVVRWPAQAYIELFRCTPLLVQLFWIFYALPAFTGIALPGFVSALIALTANLTAFMAEAYRSGFQSVAREQIEAGSMLGLSSFQRLRHIVLPQALRQQTPVILSLNISIFKDTALVSTIAVADLMFVADTITTETYRSLEILTLAAAMYFAIAFPASLLINYIERRSQRALHGQLPRATSSVFRRMLPGARATTA